MSSREHTPSTTESSASFVDAEDTVQAIVQPEIDDKDTLKEEPLSTPNHSQIQSSGTVGDKSVAEESEKKSTVVTIFDVATEIENMLNDIVCLLDFKENVNEY